jgi:truncated hemoglobin YjbI
MRSLLNEEQIGELVERFYARLTREPYFAKMFEERNVDLDDLKSKQRIFLARLAQEDTPSGKDEQARQVRDRHPFRTTPERAAVWLGHMEAALHEMTIEEPLRRQFFAKIEQLMKQVTDTPTENS